LSLLVSGVLATSLIYFWVRYMTEPLKNLSFVAGDLQTAKPEEFDLWMENLKRVDPQGQAEVVLIQQVLQRLGAAVPKLGQRLIDGEAQACLGRVIIRGLPTLKAWQADLQNLEGEIAPEGAASSLTPHQKLALIRARLETVFEDLSHLWPDPPGPWEMIELTPILQRAWRLAVLGLPPEVKQHQELAPLPPVWGSSADLGLAALYLLDFVVEMPLPNGDLGLSAGPTPAGGVRLTVWNSGEPHTPVECQKWLNPFSDPGGIQGSLGPALAAAIATQHGGSLMLAPREEGGLEFFLELPPPAVSPNSHELHN
jgi:hypothetical protein